MNIKKTKIGNIVLAIIVIMIAVLCFWFGWYTNQEGGWDTESESYVIGRMYQMQRFGILNEDNKAMFIGRYRDEVTNYTMAELFLQDAQVTPDMFWTYSHQSGLQGNVAGVINLALCAFNLSPQARLSVLTFINVFLFFLMVAAIAYWLYLELGVGAAMLCAVGTLFSNWALASMGNIYWVTWLYLLPFVVCAFLCRRYENAEKLPKFFYALVAGLVLLRFLCGFEFTSTILILVEIPVVFYMVKHWRNKPQLKKWFKVGFLLGLCMLLAFVVAIAILCVQSFIYWGDFARGIEEILQTVSVRTGAFSNSFDAPGVYGESLQVPMLEIVNSYFNDYELIAGLTVAQLALIYTVLTGFCSAYFLLRKENELVLRSVQLYVVALVASLAPLSWFILARGHSSIHVGINYILWLLPVLPLVLANMGWLAEKSAQLFANKGKE